MAGPGQACWYAKHLPGTANPSSVNHQAEVASYFDAEGIDDVEVVETQGFLSDHYNPQQTLASTGCITVPTPRLLGLLLTKSGMLPALVTTPLWLRSALVAPISVPCSAPGSLSRYLPGAAQGVGWPEHRDTWGDLLVPPPHSP